MKPKVAKIKFNGGVGALLCNKCDVIIATGTKHEDREHYCMKCMMEEHNLTITPPPKKD